MNTQPNAGNPDDEQPPGENQSSTPRSPDQDTDKEREQAQKKSDKASVKRPAKAPADDLAKRLADFNDPASVIPITPSDPLEIGAEGIRMRVEAGYAIPVIKAELAKRNTKVSLPRLRAFIKEKGWKPTAGKGGSTQ